MAPQTLLDALIQKLRGCNISGDAEEAPVAVIWTDPRSEWKPLIPLLRQQLRTALPGRLRTRTAAGPSLAALDRRSQPAS